MKEEATYMLFLGFVYDFEGNPNYTSNKKNNLR